MLRKTAAKVATQQSSPARRIKSSLPRSDLVPGSHLCRNPDPARLPVRLPFPFAYLAEVSCNPGRAMRGVSDVERCDIRHRHRRQPNPHHRPHRRLNRPRRPSPTSRYTTRMLAPSSGSSGQRATIPRKLGAWRKARAAHGPSEKLAPEL